MKISELPPNIREKALKYQRNETDPTYSKETDIIEYAFDWENTKEGDDYWLELNDKKADLNTPKHYDNSKGSLYQFCEEKQLNTYEFDCIKRIMRCRKKGNFIEDIDKTIFLLQLYKKEYESTK
jgi:hypothetical protein